MKKILVVVICIFIFLLSANVFAEGPYVSGNVGVSWLEDANLTSSDAGIDLDSDMEFDTGFLLGAAVGYDFGPLRIEAELGYRHHEFDEWKNVTVNGTNFGDFSGDGQVITLSSLVNAYVDFAPPNFPVTPYAGGGIGFATIYMNDIEIEHVDLDDDDDTVFAYQLGAGVAYAINPFLTLDIGYRYFATDDPEFDDIDTESEYNSHNISLAVRYSF